MMYAEIGLRVQGLLRILIKVETESVSGTSEPFEREASERDSNI